MTFTVGRTQIHIGWGAFAAILIAVSGATWTTSIVLNKYEAKQDRIDEKQTIIISLLRAKERKDSIQDVRLDTLTAHQTRSDYAQHDIRNDVNYLQDRRAARYVTETRDRNGHIVQHPYNNNN